MADPQYNFDGIADAPKLEAHIGAAVPMTALPDTPEGRMQAVGGAPLLPKGVRDTLNTPLAHPTGIDLIDSLTSPVNLALGAVMEGPAAARLLKGAVTGLTEKMGGALAAKILKFAIPSVLKKPAELADILSELGKLGAKADPPVAPGAPAAAPAPAPAAVAPPPAAAPVDAPATSPSVPTALSGPALTNKIVSEFGIVPIPPEELAAARKLVADGHTVKDAVAAVKKARPMDIKDAAAKLAAKFGTPSDATVESRVKARNSSGRWD